MAIGQSQVLRLCQVITVKKFLISIHGHLRPQMDLNVVLITYVKHAV